MIAVDPPVKLLIFPLASEGPSTHAPRTIRRMVATPLGLAIGISGPVGR
jgi:hypothetical protein